MRMSTAPNTISSILRSGGNPWSSFALAFPWLLLGFDASPLALSSGSGGGDPILRVGGGECSIQAVGQEPAPARPASATRVVPDLAQRIGVPSFFYHIGDVEALERACSESSVAKLFEDPEVWEFLRSNPEAAKLGGLDPSSSTAPVFAWFYDELREQTRIPESHWRSFIELIDAGLFTSDLSLAMDLPGPYVKGESSLESEIPRLYLSGSTGKEPERFDTFLVQVVDFVRSEEGPNFVRRRAFDTVSFYEFGVPRDGRSNFADPVFCVSRRAGHVLVTAPTTNVMVQLLTTVPDVPLASDARFLEAFDALGSDPASIFLYVDGQRILERRRAAATPDGLDESGLARLEWIGVTLEGAGEAIRHRIEVRADVRRGIPTLFTTKRQFDLASVLPARTVASAQMAVDGRGTSAALRNYYADFVAHRNRGTGPQRLNARLEFDARMEEMRQELGTDVKEILSLVGDEVALAVVSPETGLIPDLYAIVKAKNADAAQRLRDVAAEVLRRVSSRSSVRDASFQGQRITYTQLEGGPLYPSIYLDEDKLVIGSSVSAVKRYIQFRRSGAPSLAGRPDFQKSIASVSDGPATGYVWIDWPSITEFLYGNFSALLPFVLQGRQPGVDSDTGVEDEDWTPHGGSGPLSDLQFDWSKLPSAETLSRYITPQIVRVRIDRRGYSLDSRAFF